MTSHGRPDRRTMPAPTGDRVARMRRPGHVGTIPAAPSARLRRRTLTVALALGVLPLLAACQEDAPGAAEITAAYEARSAVQRAELLERYGTPEKMPGAVWGLASVRHEVDLTDCEKADDTRGYLCVYDLHLFAMGGDVEMERYSPVRDVEGRVYRVADGWAVEDLDPDAPK